MNGRGKSDSLIVPVRLSNKDGGALASAEEVEGRRLAKGNWSQQTRNRTQRRENLQHELGRIRQTAQRDKKHLYPEQRLRVFTQGRSPVR
jgi:hypothetical protein